jgi:Oxidoreductase-like protein, N-terminal
LHIKDHASALAVIAQLQQQCTMAGLILRDPPPDPQGCCGRGCNGCVWEGYFAAVAYWRDEALLRLQA